LVAVPSESNRLTDYWSQATWLDYVATGAMVIPYFLVTKLLGHGDWLRWLSADQRLAIYGTGATIISIIGGLGAIAVTIYITADGARARALRVGQNRYLRRNWRALFIGLGVSALACLAAQVIDVNYDAMSSRIVFIAAIVFATWRFIRLVWLFDAMINIMDHDLTEIPRLPAPELGRTWSKKTQG
jgi:hypothetical protein